jgi:hypothetical protein
MRQQSHLELFRLLNVKSTLVVAELSPRRRRSGRIHPDDQTAPLTSYPERKLHFLHSPNLRQPGNIPR